MDTFDIMTERHLLKTALTSDDPLLALRAIDDLLPRLGEREMELVRQARSDNITWDQIGLALGTTRQGAFNRYGPRMKRLVDHG